MCGRGFGQGPLFATVCAVATFLNWGLAVATFSFGQSTVDEGVIWVCPAKSDPLERGHRGELFRREIGPESGHPTCDGLAGVAIAVVSTSTEPRRAQINPVDVISTRAESGQDTRERGKGSRTLSIGARDNRRS